MNQRKSMDDWFFMRPGFDTFRLQPDKHARYLFGERDRRQRNHLLRSLEEAGYSHDGFKATVYGDYGRGKTHQCHNLVFEIQNRDLRFVPIYVKCGAYKKKEPFSSLFKELVFRHSSEELHRIAKEYVGRVNDGTETALSEIVQSEDIANVLTNGLTAPGPEAVKLSMRWLAGEPKIDLNLLGGSLKPQLADSGDFGDVMRAVSHMFIRVDDRVPLYIIDESERFQNITDTDSYFFWLAALRELTELQGVAIIFMIGAKTRDFLPTIFVQDEIVRRIGVSNYIEFLNPGRDDIRTFLLEQFQTTIRKGAVPESQKNIVDPTALDESVPDELRAITGGDEERLKTFPFDPDALDEFVAQIASGEMANKPSEAQIRVQKAAQRAMGQDRRTIDSEIVAGLETETF